MRMHRGISVVVAVLVALLALSGCARTVAGTAVAAPSGGAGATTGSDEGAVRIGTGGPTITIYLDFLCPACKNFETTYGTDITAAVRGGRLTVEYRPVSFLDRQSASGDYSSRALAAFLQVGRSGGTDATLGFLTSMFLSQPQEGGSSDLTNAEIATIAGASGTVDTAVTKIRDGATGIDGKAVGAANLKLLTAARGTGTPTVLHDGAQVSLADSAWLQKIVG
ncbi:DsbA family protein [Tsukamurella ocularis]|uniref:DsbA family protein n=1 Tax=Tsukamurella ocularis TaxID=1970234 RepID=UPI002167CAC6|nr:thioredoxin domain-containing protein [Tsukamurella ocularis]MCS3781027.1 protein-disulfide isomerase [Tsukamurella ocularis]MCS3786851.1 protein-disulfide isomerase [Tsukamurella ocularis]MCS3850693.1 protein-disulfide isomerase [Tsukamurella ocularis]